MKLEKEPRLQGASAPLIEWARKVATVVNNNDDTAIKSGALITQAAPPGLFGGFLMSTPPTGWLKANGAAVSRTAYAALFAAIGTTWGVGDGSTTFNVPDLRGEFLRGWDDARGVDAGRVFAAAQGHLLASHNHTYNGIIGNSSGATVTNIGPGSSWSITGFASGSAGGAETRPRNQTALACIKY